MLILLLLVVVTLLVASYHTWPRLWYVLLIGLQRRLAGLRSHTLEVDGHAIAYLDSGGALPPLVLLHGFGADRDAWAPLAMQLRRHYRVIAPDIPGFGDSSRLPSVRYGLDDQLGRIAAFASALGLTRFHLAGNSMGGYLAGQYAARYPAQVLSLCLIAPAGVAGAAPSELQQMLAAGDNPLLVHTQAEFERIVGMCFARPHLNPAPVRRVLGERAIRDCAFHSRLFEELFATAVSFEDSLKGLQVPTLVLWGDRDRLLHVSGAPLLHALLPHSRLEILPGVGHVPMLEEPARTARLMLEFQAGR